MKTKITVKRMITGILLILLLLSVAPVTAFPVREKSENPIRLGFFEFGGMFEGARDGVRKDGYCYEYMMQVSVYTGWNYDFYYGSYSELYEKLKAGEIDILPYTNYNEQRGQEVLFSDSVLAEEEYYLAIDPKNALITASDIDSLNGAVISTVTGADYNALLLDYIRENDLDVTISYFPNVEETWEALRSGDADVTVFTSNAYSNDGWKCICSFGKKPTYVAVAKDKPELLAQLNEAAVLIGQENPAFLGELYEKYFSDNPMRNTLLPEEQAWIDEHPVLHVGGFVNDAPYIYSIDEESHKASGLTVEVINGIVDRLGIEATADYRGYTSLAEMEAALDSGEIDVIIPFYPSYYVAQTHDLIISNVVRVSNMELVYKNGTSYSDALRKVATPSTKLGIYYVQDNFPDSEIVGAVSIQDAVDKVRSGEALGAVAQNVVLHNIKEKYDDLSSVVLPQGCGTCFAARPEDYALIRILNRGLNYFSEAEISAISSQYELSPNVTTKAYLTSHKEVVVLLGIILVTFIALILALLKVNSLFVKEKMLHSELEDARNQAEAANASKTAFLFNMSHDIRTPMNAIMGFTGMAVKHIDDKEKALDCLSKTQQSGNMLLSLINSVLEVSRIESGNAVLEEQPGDVYFSFANIETTMHELAEAKDITLTFEIEDIRDRYVYCDYSRCIRIFVNVISNAIKYTREGGYVKVRCEQVDGAQEGYGLYRYTVADNGIGMSEEFRQHVFDQFAREQNSTVSGIQGSGIGMAVCKSFTDLMGGTIECQSKQGVGTTFTITLPFKLQEGTDYIDPVNGKPVSGSAVSDIADHIDLNGMRALLVEDNELNREIAIDMLTEEGVVIEEACNGSEAVDLLREKGPKYYDFILMDIQMPVMNGYEATKEIRKMFPEDHIPIFALSANAFAEDKEASLAAGMDAHIAKPINNKELFRNLARSLK